MNKRSRLLVALLSIIAFTPINLFSALCNECTLTQIAGSPFTANLSNPTSLAFSPIVEGHPLCLSAVNSTSNTVSTFIVDPITCALTPAGSPVPTGGTTPMGLAYSPSGNCVAVANFGSPGDPMNPGSVAIFSVDRATCQLTLVGTPIVVPGAISPLFLTFSPDGNCLIVTNEFSNNLSIFSINPTTCIPTFLAFAPVTYNPITAAFSKNGNCLAVASTDIVGTQNGFLDIFTIDKSNCNLTHTIGPVSSGGKFATSVSYADNNCLAVANSDLFAGNASNGYINIFSSNPTNCSISGPSAPILTGGVTPILVSYSPDGRCLAVSNIHSDNLTIFNNNPLNCSLTQLGSPIATGRFPRMMAYSPDGNCLAVANSDVDPTGQLPAVGTGSISIFRTNVAPRQIYAQSELSKAIQAKYCPNCRIS